MWKVIHKTLSPLPSPFKMILEKICNCLPNYPENKNENHGNADIII